MAERPVRIGVLGAARNVPFTVLAPISSNPDLAAQLQIAGLAGKDAAEAEAACKEWGIQKSYASCEDLLADPSVDAVYNSLPGALRCQWTVRALLAGKHVLSETPLCMNAFEAVAAQRAAEDSGKVLLEGSHPTCHPVSKRVREMIVEGAVGRVERIDLHLPVGHSLQGKYCAKTGALLGVGCHGVAIIRALSGEEPRVISAKAQAMPDNAEVDQKVSVELALPSGGTAHFECSVDPSTAAQPSRFTINGSNGVINVREWFTGKGKGSHQIELEQFDGCGEKSTEYVANTDPESRDTFYFQLMSFATEVREQERQRAVGMPWDYRRSGESPTDAVRNMALIDSIYRAAGLAPHVTAAPPPEPYSNIALRSKL